MTWTAGLELGKLQFKNAVLTSDQKIVFPLADLVGTFRRFGERGPIYEIVGAAKVDGDADVELASVPAPTFASTCCLVESKCRSHEEH